jgi:hypothetical protein
MMGLMVSPLTGADGNVEFLAYLEAHAAQGSGPSVATAAAVAAAVSEAASRHGTGSD